MNAIDRVIAQLVYLTTGGFYIGEGKIFSEGAGRLMRGEDIAAAVQKNPREIGVHLAKFIVDDDVRGIPEKLLIRLGDAATVEDIEEATRLIAEDSLVLFINAKDRRRVDE